MHDPYAPHDRFIRPAFAAPQLWRVIMMIVAFEVVFALSDDVFTAFLPNEALRDEFYEGVTTFGTLAQFLSFGFALGGFLMLLNLLHGRGFRSLTGPTAEAGGDLIRVLGTVCLCLAVIEILPPWYDPAEVEMAHSLFAWLGLFPVTLAVLLVQVGTEEVFFRGYLQQQFAAISRSPLAWMILPSVMFGGLHYWNGHGPAEGALWAIWATGLGIACADLTARTGNIGAAIGLHMANNAFALLIVHIAGWPSSGVALFLFPHQDPEIYSGGIEVLFEPWMIYEGVILGLSTYIMWLAARITLRC